MNPERPKAYVRENAILLILLLWGPTCAPCQGVFTFWNPGAPTYMGVLGGPLAGPGIVGQALVGLTNSSLAPLGSTAGHQANGLVLSQIIGVDFASFYTYVQVQMTVWDGALWGTNFANVPPSQLGFTDIVPVEVVKPLDAFYYSPHFTQSAVVPAAPEPSTVSLILFAAGTMAVIFRFRRCRQRKSAREE